MAALKPAIIILATLALVIFINIGIYYSVKRGAAARSHRVWGKLARRAANPWQTENQNLDELSRQVTALKTQQESQDADHAEHQNHNP